MTGLDAQCLRLAAEGRAAKQIGQELGMSESTVEWHLLMARRSLGAANTVEAVYRFMKQQATRKPKIANPVIAEQSRLDGSGVA